MKSMFYNAMSTAAFYEVNQIWIDNIQENWILDSKCDYYLSSCLKKPLTNDIK
jgi:hypothetical protein